jgi:integrase
MLSAGYVAIQRGFLTQHIWPELGDLPVDAMTLGQVEDWLTGLPAKKGRLGTPLTPTTVNHVFGCLRKIMREGVRRRELRYDPTEGVDLLKENRKVRGVFSVEEIAKLFKPEAIPTVWSGLVLHYAANMLACVTGARMGELQGLQRQHAHVEGAQPWIDIQHGWRRTGELAKPKAGSFGGMLIPKATGTVLATIMADSPYQEPEDLVFWGRNGRTPVGSRKIGEVFSAALGKIGIPLEEQRARVLVFHSWRHTFTTGQRARGMADAKLAKVTRHKTTAMVEHYGSHFAADDPDFIAAAEATGRWLEGKA